MPSVTLYRDFSTVFSFLGDSALGRFTAEHKFTKRPEVGLMEGER